MTTDHWRLQGLAALAPLGRSFRGLKAPLAGLVGLGLVTSLLEGLSVSLLTFVIYKLLLSNSPTGSGGFFGVFYSITERVSGGSVAALLGLVAIAVATTTVLSGLYGMLAVWIRGRFEHQIRVDLFSGYMRAPYAAVARRDPGELTNTLFNETWIFSEAVSAGARIVSNTCAVAVYLLLLMLVSPLIAIAAVAAGALLAILAQTPRRLLARVAREITHRHEKLAQHLFSRLHGIRTVRAFGQERDEIAAFTNLSEATRGSTTVSASVQSWTRPILDMLALFSVALLIWLSVRLGAATVTSVTTLALLYRIQPHLRDVHSATIAVFSAHGAIEAIARALRDFPSDPPATGKTPPAGWTEITFDRVGYAHLGAETPALSEVSFAIRRGASVALLGESGAGKTTVIALLLRLYEPTSGAVLIDGAPLSALERRGWLTRVAVAGQDIDLLDGTIFDNLRWAAPDLDRAEAERLLGLAGILDFVRTLPGGMDASVTDRGLSLSGGQRQRIALARALARRPDLLILDEASNAIDAAVEAEILASLRAALPDLTILTVAHRGGAIDEADLVVVLKQGRVAEVGTPASLRLDKRAAPHLAH